MNVYVLGKNIKSDTNNYVIVTVELCNLTDLKGINLFHDGVNRSGLYTTFYRQLKINCGKVIRITDLMGKQSFDTAHIDSHEIHIDKYFFVENYNFENNCLIGYQYQIAVIEQAGYVGADYNGVAYKHYSSGLIEMKKYYCNGKLYSCYTYRDDKYNTHSNTKLYNNKILESEMVYNEREIFMHQIWYNLKGEIYSTISNPNAVKKPDPTEPEPALAPAPTVKAQVVGSGSGSESESEHEAYS
jgi:hypothetical protein